MARLLAGSPRRRLVKLESKSPAIAPAAMTSPSQTERPISGAATAVTRERTDDATYGFRGAKQAATVIEPQVCIDRINVTLTENPLCDDGCTVRQQHEKQYLQQLYYVHAA